MLSGRLSAGIIRSPFEVDCSLTSNVFDCVHNTADSFSPPLIVTLENIIEILQVEESDFSNNEYTMHNNQ